MSATEVIHIAGSWLQVGPQLRQRCAWCGATLIDMDLSRVAVPEGQDPTPAKWEPGSLVGVLGNAQWAVPHTEAMQMKSDSPWRVRLRSWLCTLRRHPRKRIDRSDGETVYTCDPCILEFPNP